MFSQSSLYMARSPNEHTAWKSRNWYELTPRIEDGVEVENCSHSIESRVFIVSHFRKKAYSYSVIYYSFSLHLQSLWSGTVWLDKLLAVRMIQIYIYYEQRQLEMGYGCVKIRSSRITFKMHIFKWLFFGNTYIQDVICYRALSDVIIFTKNIHFRTCSN